MTTRYTDYKNGSDTTPGDGTSANPYKTLTKAKSVSSNGDTILCRGGSAADEIYYDSGIASTLTSLTVAADTGHAPVFTPAVLYTSWAKSDGLTNVYQTAFTPANLWGAWNGAQELAKVASTALCDATANTCYGDTTNDLLYVNIGGTQPAAIQGVSSTNQLFNSTGDGLTLRGLTWQWADLYLFDTTAANTITLSGCTVQYIDTAFARSMVRFRGGSGHLVTGCTFIGQGARHIGVASDTGVPTSVTVTGCTFRLLDFATKFTTGTGFLLTLNSMDRCDDGLYADAGTTGTMSYNTATDVGHSGYLVSGAGADWDVHHNTIWTPGAPTLTGANGFVVELNANCRWYHNTCDGLERCSSNGRAFLIESNGTVVVKNNISSDNKYGFIIASATPTLTTDYNCAYSNSSGNYAGGWTEGAHGITSDPLLTAPQTGDLTLGAASPCRRAGAYITGVSESNPSDIGRYETARPKRRVLAGPRLIL